MTGSKEEWALTRVLRSTYCILYHPPTLAHVVDICKWKERDEGRKLRNQKSIAKEKKREPKTKLQKEMWF
jgi:hypothetical protein